MSRINAASKSFSCWWLPVWIVRLHVLAFRHILQQARRTRAQQTGVRSCGISQTGMYTPHLRELLDSAVFVRHCESAHGDEVSWRLAHAITPVRASVAVLCCSASDAFPGCQTRPVAPSRAGFFTQKTAMYDWGESYRQSVLPSCTSTV
jgi:hypothetical protein